MINGWQHFVFVEKKTGIVYETWWHPDKGDVEMYVDGVLQGGKPAPDPDEDLTLLETEAFRNFMLLVLGAAVLAGIVWFWHAFGGRA